MTAGDTLTCTINNLAYGGDGIARVDGRVLFIPETAAGDTALVRITQVKKHFARAEVTKLLEASPDRAEPCCRVRDPDTGDFARVPGCVYDHLSYEAELRAKTDQLQGFLCRLPSHPLPDGLSAVGSPASLHYRNKVVLHAARSRGGMCLGYRQEPVHRVLDIEACPLACGEINGALSAVRSSERFHQLRAGADITFRHTPHDGTLAWTGDQAILGSSPDLLTENSPLGPLRVPRNGFYQVNPAVADVLVRTVARWFAEDSSGKEILDLYCGVGVFGLACLAQGGTRLVGVESGRDAVSAARQNAEALGAPASFLCHALGHTPLPLASLAGSPWQTTAIIDPPREGMAAGMTNALAESGIARLIYVSCDPATLARDLSLLLANRRYRLARAQLFDMFPRTAHFETAVELIRA